MAVLPQWPDYLPENTLFLLLSFEGPDIYSQAGGLGVRMAELSASLARAGCETKLFFIGDPELPGVETQIDGRLTYYRWCQWISRYHPLGVYDGEEGKLHDYQTSLPGWIYKNIVPKTRKQIVVLSEEWQTAQTAIALSQLVTPLRKQSHTLFLWNANNVFGFDRINWPVLKRHATLTTVSRYMKQLMREIGVDPLVIPNGIPQRWFDPIAPELKTELKNSCGGNPLLAKVGRFDPDKRWVMVIESMAQLKKVGCQPKLLMRGAGESHGEEVRTLSQRLGLKIVPIHLKSNATAQEFFQAIRRFTDADVFDLQFFVPEEMLRLIYWGADAVLANSRHEPFGLVGLEVMASRGVAVTGNTGEDYARNFQNAIVVDTDDPWELTTTLISLDRQPRLAERLRDTGYESAKAFQWPFVIEELKRKLEYVGTKIGDSLGTRT